MEDKIVKGHFHEEGMCGRAMVRLLFYGCANDIKMGVPTERPNITIISQLKTYVNISRREGGVFCILYHFDGSYL